MAEQSEGSDWQAYGNWLGGWIRTVKETSVSAMEVVKTQSASAVEMVKRDLNDFTQTMQCDTSRTAARIRDNITEEEEEGGGMKAGISTLLGGISRMLMVDPDSDDESEQVLIARSGPVFDSSKARLEALRLDPDTYLTEVEDVEDFHQWLDNFVVDDHKGQISELLVTNADIRAIYTNAVPGDVSHALFWERYFYRVNLLERDEMRRSQLKQRARSIETSVHEDLPDDWVDFDAPASPTEPSFMERARMRHSDQSQITELQEPETITMSHDVPSLPPLVTEISDSEHSSEQKSKLDESPEAATDKNCDLDKNISETSNDSDIDVLDTEGVDISERSSPERVRQNLSLGVADVILAESRDDDLDQSPYLVGNSNNDQSIETNVENSNKKSQDSNQTGSELNTSGSDVDQTDLEVELKTREKGDMVLVGARNGGTPTDSTDSKESVVDVGEDWEDFDVEVTEDDLKVAQEMAESLLKSKTAEDDDDDDDWDSWE